jgi:leader peptidase (prepilin peptidase)/N-methyltransferase
MDPGTIFKAENWAMPFHFWSAVFFVFGCVVGSFLNVCIHRMPLGQSIVSPPSHCPHCKYSIPWFLNIPLFTWLYLRGKCANCGAPISIRYFLVELLTGITFLSCWLWFGNISPWLAIVFCVFLSGLIVATFTDFEHFIIPDEITFGGIAAGFLLSFLFPVLHQGGIIPLLHQTGSPGPALGESFFGIVVGAGLIYLIVRLGKLAFGRQQFNLAAGSRVIFTETTLVLPEGEIPYEEIFYRKSDTIHFEAGTLELCDRGYKNVAVRLSQNRLEIGEEVLNPEDVPYVEATTSQLTVPREVMGLGDVKFMAAIGAFLGWQGVVFSLGVSSFLGAIYGIAMMVLRRQERSRPIQYGPFIALAAVIWIFGGYHQWNNWMHFLVPP